MPAGYRTTADVAALLNVKEQTIRLYRAGSKPGGRYANHPFPKPDDHIGRMPLWREERDDEIRAWDASRPGRGALGGVPGQQRAQQVRTELDRIPVERGNMPQQTLRMVYNDVRRHELAENPTTPARASLERALKLVRDQYPDAPLRYDEAYFGAGSLRTDG